jgi:hypothetical protein
MYPLSKATSVDYQTVNLPSNYVTVAQRYEAPQPVTVHGVCFYAYTLTGGSPAAVDVYLYNTDGANLPDSILATASTTVPVGTGTPYTDYRQCVTFSTPIIVAEDYCVAVDGSVTSEQLAIGRNSFAFSDGGAEALSSVYFDDLTGASYVKWYDQTNDPAFTSPGPAWDYDYLIEPIVSYDLYLTATYGADSICSGESWCVETDSISPIFNHKMYNQDYAGNQITDWADGSQTAGDSACHVFATASNYMVTHSRAISGWEISCSLAALDSVFNEDPPTANFTYSTNSDTVAFTNTSAGYSGGSWTFGTLGSSMASDTIYVFPNGSHAIELAIYSALGCTDTITQIININVGISENELPELTLYPNPTAGLLNIVNAAGAEQLNLIIRDMTGKVLITNKLVDAVSSINLWDLAQGQYLVQVSNENGMRIEKIQVIK